MKLVVRMLQESLQHAELVEDFHRRGMNGVASEIVKEVGVFLEYLHIAAGAGEQQSRHHAGGPAANDDQIQVFGIHADDQAGVALAGERTRSRLTPRPISRPGMRRRIG